MKLGIVLPYSSADMSLPIDRVLEAERLGFDSVWTSEAYGSDAVAPAAWVLARTTRIKVGTAIMQMPARTPAMTAMTAMTLDALSGGRFVLGIGPSGPQVVEGWHGVAYGKPLMGAPISSGRSARSAIPTSTPTTGVTTPPGTTMEIIALPTIGNAGAIFLRSGRSPNW